MTVIEVAAGLIQHEGRYLITRRKAGVHLAGYWEFPGGKREAGELLEACLQRELFEELGVRIGTPVPYRLVSHEYPENIVELHFFRCAIESGEAQPLDCAELRWVLPEEFDRFQFPPVDRVILAALQREAATERL